jgi:Domain of unknown function (DUF4332)
LHTYFFKAVQIFYQSCSKIPGNTVSNAPDRRFTAFSGRNWPIADLPGLKLSECEQLAAIGLHTTQDLLRHSVTPAQQTTIAQALHLHLHHVQKWRALCDLARIPSIGHTYCGVLLHAGVPSVRHLATLAPGRLHRQIMQLQMVATGKTQRCPPPALVQQWILQAQQL